MEPPDLPTFLPKTPRSRKTSKTEQSLSNVEGSPLLIGASSKTIPFRNLEIPVSEKIAPIKQEEKKWHVEIPWYKTIIKGSNNPYTVFSLRVFYGDVKWVVEKRFSECLAFSENLSSKYQGVPPFPPRQPKFLQDPKFLQIRHRDLELYFQKFDQSSFDTNELRNFLNVYTELKKQGIHLRTNPERLRPVIPDVVMCTTSSVTKDGITLSVRMTVIKLKNGELLLYSPTCLDDALRSELEDLGKVRYLVAPNKLHYTFLPGYLEAFPEAILYVAPGLKEKVIPGMENALVLKGHPEPEWESEVDQMLTEGNSFFSEVLMFHKETRVLLVADLVMNFPPGVFSGITEGAMGLSSLTYQFFSGPLATRPMCSPEHSIYCTDTKAFQMVYERLIDWHFEIIIMCHGEILDNAVKAKEALTSAFEEVTKKVNERWGFTNTVFSLLGGKKE